jgi:transformation/transcription domain-associated protein
LGDPTRTDIIFVDEQATGNDVSEEKYLKATIHAIMQRPEDSTKRHRQRTATLVQLFERALKSLAVYPGNEVIVRKHLRFIVTFCLRASFENTSEWPESYPMLLRYVFRAISAGKFEDSYRELLSLIPTVLNGLCRVVTSAEDSVLRNTAIELCLTIPARLSSLLPHMNLLLRIIIPALDSNSNELVNLGYVQC